MRPSFSTIRLHVRDLADLDKGSDGRAALDAALPVILTEPVLRHLPPDLRHSGAQFDMQAWVRILASRNVVGVVTTVADAAPIGFLALRKEARPGRAPILWLGYLFAEHAWGHGYATELVEGVVAALPEAKDAELHAGIAAGNDKSARVLRKAGFVADPEQSGEDWTLFTRPMA